MQRQSARRSVGSVPKGKEQMTETAPKLPARPLTPSYARACVSDAMHTGVISCPPDVSMESVARIMTANRVHSVVVGGLGLGPAWGVVTDRDVLAAGGAAADRLAGSCAAGEVVSIGPDEPLEAAVELMLRHGVSHLVVAGPGGGPPLGILSSLDVAGVIAWGR